MTEKIKKMLERLKTGDYKKLRTDGINVTSSDFNACGLCPETFGKLANSEKPQIFDKDSFGFNRSTKTMFSSAWCNITPNYARVISDGVDKTIQDIQNAIISTDDEEKKEYGNIMSDMLSTAMTIAERYREEAKNTNKKLFDVLSKIPRQGANDYYEALVFMKFCIFFLRLAGNHHLTLGRFDRYMYPFYRKSKENGVTDEELFELTEEFFISINYDTDLYCGVQQGDNGQSMVLGGFDKDGNYGFNELSKMCMEASLELSLIDPKINLRVGKNTPDELYEYATLLTKNGLGFPQYCNDDVVVPGLIKLGYAPEDAYDYTVAACWEYIIPNCGGDISNLSAMDFPNVVNKAITENLLKCESFDSLKEYVRTSITSVCGDIIESHKPKSYSFAKSPLLSVFIDGCIQKLTDVCDFGGKYFNFGCHGAGIANAADALAAVKKFVFDEKKISKKELLDALEANFEGYIEIRNLLRTAPKMGNNDDFVDDIADFLMDVFSENMNNKPNGFGGIWRAGTGSAMEYLRKGKSCPATADGRKAGEPYSSSFSPSLDVKPSGLLSVIRSFTKHDMTNIINGGPLTIEVHDTVFRNDIGIKKTAALVKSFVELGGHQLQINSINKDTLIDAQKHPEKYPNLIVRVWGWSGYFNELDVEYQDHIVRRCEFNY